ncbi:MAG: DNA mismatch repair endonuclease MutL [Acidobacteriota bacterium]
MLPCRIVGCVHILPRHEAERIAAGEVIERPASVVRELLENSLDAGSRHIEMDLRRGGLGEIRVADDGTGMEPEDALLALARHATSKISGLEDLDRLHTLGFRGEALPSIAAVSRLELLTAQEPGGAATLIRIEGPVEPRAEPASRSRGTTVSVGDLFYNTPARRKFARSPAAEFTRISEVVVPRILAHPEVGFVLRHDGRESLRVSPAPTLRERLAALWGAGQAGRLVGFQGEAGTACVHGFISGPDDSRASRRHWYLLVNGRPVRDRMLMHAVTAGIGEALPKGRFPSVVLLLDLPAGELDVNVHPAKAEVRFADSNRVHALIASALRRATRPATYVATGPAPVGDAVGVSSPADPSPVSGLARWEVGEPPAMRQPGSLFDAPPPAAGDPGEIDGLPARSAVVLAQYRDCFIVAHDAEALYLIDQHVAHERILYEAIRRDLGEGRGERQALLFPHPVDVTDDQARLIESVLPLLARFGFDAEPFGPRAVTLRQVPAYLAEGQAVPAFRDLVEILATTPDAATATGQTADRLQHRLAATVACHAAVKIHFPLTREKMEYLVGELFRCAEPLTCPHGRRVVSRWAHDDLLRTFGRL